MTTAPLTQTDDALRFPSLASLRAAHSELLKRSRVSGDTPDTIAAIQDFIRRGRATGALLDAEADRWTAQTQLDYWGTQLYRPGQAPIDATLDDFDPSLAPELDDALCPYLGLDAFHESDRRVFFGRERLIGELVKQVRINRWLSVLGSSGSGKSSVVRAGLIPALEQGALSGSDRWFYFPPLVPGSHPLANLARLVLPPEADDARVASEADRMRQDPAHLTNLIAACSNREVVLVIDQFEEIFTLCTDEVMRQRFVDNLIDLSQTPTAQGHVIVTMRTDFETQVARLPQLQALFEQSAVRLTPLNAAELREAIEAPAALIGLKFEEGVVDALLSDTLGEPAALPLLQFTLLKLWEGRERNRVTWEAYKQLGGGRQALARSADEFYNKLIPEEQVTMRRILLKMVRPGEGLEVTSNRVPRAVLYQKAEANDRVDRVLDRLIKVRLVRVSEGDTAADEQVEVAHEALVRNWPRLVEWLEEDRVTLRQRQRLTAAAEQWARLGKDPTAVWRGALLDEARRYDDLNDLERQFIAASVGAEEAERQLEEARRQKELEDARRLAESEKQRADLEVKNARRLRRLTAALVIVSVFAVIAAVLALRNSQYAEAQRIVAEDQRAEAVKQQQAAEAGQNAAEAARVEADNQRQEAEKQSRLAEDLANTMSQFAADNPNAMLAYFNYVRAENGLPPFEMRESLSKIAEAHSKYMAENGISHMGADGSSAKQRITNAGYGAGHPTEEIFGGQATMSDAFQFWVNDPVHLNAILDPVNTVVGIGIYKSGNGTYYTVDLGRPAQ
jgi:uncharacterized protein YkwD